MPFAAEVLEPSHGAFITSATLRDRPPEAEEAVDGWRSAEIRTGAGHLVTPPVRAAFASPFDYGRQTRVLVVRDLNRDADLIAGAYRDLFVAAGGGALGLFTSIRSLRHTHRVIAGSLSEHGLPLYAQHVDGLDTGSLVDLFREDEDSVFAGHRCFARRRRCAGALVAARRVRARAVAASGYSPQSAPGCVRQGL